METFNRLLPALTSGTGSNLGFLAYGVQFNLRFEERAVRTSLPKIGAGVMPDKSAPEKPNANDAASIDKFSSALAEATHKANTNSRKSTTADEAEERRYSSGGKATNGRDSQPLSGEKVDEPTRTTLSQEAPAACAEAPQRAQSKDGGTQPETGVGTIATAASSDFNVNTSWMLQSAVLPAAQAFTSYPYLSSVSQSMTAAISSLKPNLATVGDTTDSQPPELSNVPAGTSGAAPVFTSNGAAATVAAMAPNNLQAVQATEGEQADGNFALQDQSQKPETPIVPSQPVLPQPTAPEKAQNQQLNASATPVPVRQNESALATAALPKTAQVATLPTDALGSGNNPAKAASDVNPRIESANSSQDAVHAPVQKAESHPSSATPHMVERGSSLAPETNNPEANPVRPPIALGNTPPPSFLMFALAADGRANEKFESPKQNPVTPVARDMTSSAEGATPVPAGADPASSVKTKADSEGTTIAVSSASAQADSVSSITSLGKSPDVTALNVTPVAGSAIDSRAERSVTKSESRLPEGSVQAAEGEIASDQHTAAIAGYSGSLFQSARLVERLGQAELRVGIQAGEFGTVDIRTSMVRNQFSAEISVERGELGRVLAAELPSLQNRLSEQRVPTANITLQNQSSNGGSAGFEQGSRQSQNMQPTAIFHNIEEEPVPVATVAAAVSAPGTRLDIHM